MQRQIPSEASCWNITNRPPDLHSPSIQNILLWILLKKQPDIRYPTLDILQRDVAPSANPPQRDIAFACAFPPPWIDTKLQAARSVCTFLPSRFVLWPFPDKAPSCAPALFAPLLYIVSFRSPFLPAKVPHDNRHYSEQKEVRVPLVSAYPFPFLSDRSYPF